MIDRLNPTEAGRQALRALVSRDYVAPAVKKTNKPKYWVGCYDPTQIADMMDDPSYSKEHEEDYLPEPIDYKIFKSLKQAKEYFVIQKLSGFEVRITDTHNKRIEL